jgi:hypothetical protein
MKKELQYMYYEIVSQIEHSEIDFELSEYVFGKSDDSLNYRTIMPDSNKKYSWANENEHIEINLAIQTLQDLKDKGATHVEIVPHNDHNGYVFYGNFFRKATDEEINEQTKRNIKTKKLVLEVEYKRAKELIDNYENELKKLNECD